MAWVYLGLAGLFEVGWAVGLKYTAGFTRIRISELLALIARVSPAYNQALFQPRVRAEPSASASKMNALTCSRTT